MIRIQKEATQLKVIDIRVKNNEVNEIIKKKKKLKPTQHIFSLHKSRGKKETTLLCFSSD